MSHSVINNIKDYSGVLIADLTGAVRHHHYFTTSRQMADEIRNAADFIKQNGAAKYLAREYPDTSRRSKNIIINKIDSRLFVTDGNKHCVSLVTASPDITIGDLLKLDKNLFRYWENGNEQGAETEWQPYSTYIPFDADVSRLSAEHHVYQSRDERGADIHRIPSNVAYDSPLFSETDRGRAIRETAHTLEVEAVYEKYETYGKTARDMPEISGNCGRMYDVITKLNVKYGYVKENSGYDHVLITFIAGRVLQMSIDDPALAAKVRAYSQEELARHIFAVIDNWVRHK
ncbi:MAG: hypothetical protein LBO63_04175 [Oscillospiraceae bacterium]|jgi:hypothetical protein|nr:hypothetical protein [Oscillospiraceae bacterium]